MKRDTRSKTDRVVDTITITIIAGVLLYGVAWLVGSLLAYHAGR